jgi:hypothetical protein
MIISKDKNIKGVIIMKCVKYLSLILFSVFALHGCSKDTGGGAFTDTQVTIVKSNVTFACEGGSGEIVVDTGGDVVTAVSDQTWCAVSVSGQTIKVTVGENSDRLSRSAVVTLRSGEKENYVPVYQGPIIIKLDAAEVKAFGYAHKQTVAYSCGVAVNVTSDQPWLKASASDGNIVLDVDANTEFTAYRSAKITVSAGGGIVTEVLSVSQNPTQPTPDVESLSDFLNLKNNGSSSRYKITEFSPALDEYYQALKTKFPILEEMRIEAPRSSYRLSVILSNNNSTTYYWNATNGLVPVNDSKSVGAFALSGNTRLGANPPYLSDPDYVALRAIFAAATGFTIFPGDNNTFVFRSEADTTLYFTATAASW